MNNRSIRQHQQSNWHQEEIPYAGQRWLVEERDACGVGFIASVAGVATHKLIEQSLSALGCLEHRGGCSADQDSGDGAGVMTAIPWQLIEEWFTQAAIEMPPRENLGIGMVFLPQEESLVKKARAIVEAVLSGENLTVLGWRVVPVQESVLGIQARENQPQIEQVIVASPNLQGDELERALYMARRRIGKALDLDGTLKWSEDIYICSFSNRTIVYKGMVRSSVLGEFYLDLKNPDYCSAFAVYHRRFSTNTMPKWPLAQPMRLLGHNGEINTVLGNINWMTAREADLNHPLWGPANSDAFNDLKPTVNADSSDSANLDNVLELLVCSGRSPVEALMMMVPEAYKNQPD
ncbi:MAG: glutamate synthase subunit alpha, partial [Coleofasciculaceae cyanobacterium]